jgi:hypothetical protein
LAAGTSLKAKQHSRNDDKLEEDLGSVAVRSGTDGAVAANPRAVRSQFSRSTKQTVPSNEAPTSLAGIKGVYPSFDEELQAAAGRIDMSARLQSSPEYRGLVH